jgi:hypothetical protein
MKVNIEGDSSYELTLGKENKLQIKRIEASKEDIRVVAVRIEKSEENSGKSLLLPDGEYVNFELGKNQESLELCYIRGIISAAQTAISSFIFYDNGHYFKLENGKLTNYLETTLEEGLETDGLSTVYMLEEDRNLDSVQGVHLMFIPKAQKIKFLLLGVSKKDYILPFSAVVSKVGGPLIAGNEAELATAFKQGVVIFMLCTLLGVGFSLFKAPFYKKGEVLAAQIKTVSNAMAGQKPADYTGVVNSMGLFFDNNIKQNRMVRVNKVFVLMGKYQLEPTGINLGQDSVTISTRTQTLQNATRFLQEVQTDFPGATASPLAKEGGVYYGFSINVGY